MRQAITHTAAVLVSCLATVFIVNKTRPCAECPDLKCPPNVRVENQKLDTKKIKNSEVLLQTNFNGPVYYICNGDTSLVRGPKTRSLDQVGDTVIILDHEIRQQ